MNRKVPRAPLEDDPPLADSLRACARRQRWRVLALLLAVVLLAEFFWEDVFRLFRAATLEPILPILVGACFIAASLHLCPSTVVGEHGARRAWQPSTPREEWLEFAQLVLGACGGVLVLSPLGYSMVRFAAQMWPT